MLSDQTADHSGWFWLESLVVFALGLAIMLFLYGSMGEASGDKLGLPGHDSFYHTKMASMIPDHGLVSEFPWLRYAYFREQGNDFVSHHYGFHMLLMPFVRASRWLTGNEMPGARLAISVFFGVNLMLFNLLLIHHGVRYRWLWLALFLFLPHQFFSRHAYVRAIGASLIFMQAILLLMFQRRYVWCGVIIALYVHLYLGAVTFAPVLVIPYAAALAIGPRGDRTMPWKLALCTGGGWLLGLLTYPYGGVYEFLKLQILGSGLSPDIEVGREWKSYSPAWFFVQMSGVLLFVWTVSLCARLRLGKRLDAREAALLVLNFVFLLLTLKARRFIEYWPIFCLLSAAYLTSPLLSRWHEACERLWRQRGVISIVSGAVSISVLLCIIAIPFILRAKGVTFGADSFRAAWPMWAGLAGLYLLVHWGRIWLGAGQSRCLEDPPTVNQRIETSRRISASLGATAVAGGLVMLVCAGAGPMLTGIKDKLRCGYDLPAIRSAMTYLKDNSAAGDVIFTDDWDIFPVYFYFNSHNHYIVGLDPKFTHARRPDLWQRYVKISRGQVPAHTTYTETNAAGKETVRRIHVKLEDIREHFGAQYVITDRDHKSLAALLNEADDFAVLVYPSANYRAARNAPYLIFRIIGGDSRRAAAAPPQPDRGGNLYLHRLTPLSVEQGWGDLAWNRSVGGGPIKMRRQVYPRGIGTHAPSRIEYEIPPGYALFEAFVGVDDATDGEGSIVASIELDGRSVFQSDELTGLSEPAVVRVPLGDARKLVLIAATTKDGQQFDHVDWANARLVRDAPTK